MHCRHCKSENTRVIDSRETGNGFTVHRRRKCLQCNFRFSTKEFLVDPPIMVSKARRPAEPFNAEKVRIGLEKACKNLPVTTQKLEEMTQAVEEKLQNSGKLEIASRQIGDFVYEELKKTNLVAAFHFARVYKKLKNIEDLKEELRQLELEFKDEKTLRR